MKKLIPVLLLVLLLGVCVSARADDCPVNPYRDFVEGILSGDVSAAADKLTISISQTAPASYDTPAAWSVSVSGGAAPYTFDYVLGSVNPDSNTADSEGARSNTSSSTYSYQFTVPGTYYLYVYVTDSAGYQQLEIYGPVTLKPTASHPTIDDIAESIAAKCKLACSDTYDRAVWLYDYLTLNARYDYTYSYYGPDGVLLRGTGVCDSYSKAYVLLLKKIGVNACRVTGGNHAWVIAQIEGTWAMFDPTWDDPGESAEPVSGHETHLNFGITTELIEYEHTIEDDESNGHARACTSLALNYAVRKGDALQWMNDDMEGFTVSGQLNEWMENVSLYTWLTIPTICLKELGGGWYIPGQPDNPLIWVPVAEVISGMTLPLDGVNVPITAEFYRDSGSGDILVEPDFDLMPAVILPDDTIEVGEGAFWGDSEILQVIMPEGTVSIGSRAFGNCSRLLCLDIPGTVNEIADDCLSGSNRVTVLCPEGSFAEEWAVENNIPVLVY